MTKKTDLFKYLMVALVFSGLALYLSQVEQLTSGNYRAKEYEKERQAESEKNSALEAAYLQKFSIKGAFAEALSTGFVDTNEIKYIPVAFDYLARETTY